MIYNVEGIHAFTSVSMKSHIILYRISKILHLAKA